MFLHLVSAPDTWLCGLKTLTAPCYLSKLLVSQFYLHLHSDIY